MKKEEVIALGVPEENYKIFQERYSRDLDRRVKTLAAKNRDTTPELRDAIMSMVTLIKQPETLENVLRNTFMLHCSEDEAPRPEATTSKLEETLRHVNED